MMNRKLVVSTYCSDLNWITMTHDYGIYPKDTIIYSRTPDQYDEDYSHLGTYLKSPNIGENIYDILRFIIENYNILPDMSIFIKGNLFSRKKDATFNHPKPGEKYEIDENYYTTREKFIEALTSDSFLPIDKQHLTSLSSDGFVQPVEDINFYKNHEVEHRYFGHFHEMIDACFVDPPKRETVRFAPGANYAVPKKNILNYSKNFYEKLKSFISYEPKPEYVRTTAESYLLERMFYFMWTEDLVEK